MAYLAFFLWFVRPLFAAQPEPQLAMLPGIGCLLGYPDSSAGRARLQCWSRDEEDLAEEDLPVRHPLAVVSAGTTDICALDDDRIRCFHKSYEMGEDNEYRWREAKMPLSGKSGFTRIWGSSGWTPEICGERASGEVLCTGAVSWGKEPPRPQWYNTTGQWLTLVPYQSVLSRELRPSHRYPGSLALNHLMICALNDDRQVHCQVNPQNAVPERVACAETLNAAAPKDLHNPAGLILDIGDYTKDGRILSCRACIEDTDRLVCWGTHTAQSFSRVYRIPGLRPTPATAASASLFPMEKPQAGFLSIPNSHESREVPCVLHQRRVLCPTAADDSEMQPPEGIFDSDRWHPLLAVFFNAVTDEHYCLADETALRCNRKTAAHHQRIHAVGLESAAWSIREIASHAYRADAAFLRKAADALMAAGDQDEDRLFVVNAVTPLIDNTPSAYFESTVKPALSIWRETYNPRYRIEGLASVPGNHQKLALSMFRAALEGLRADLPAPLVAEVWERLGAALATGGRMEKAALSQAYRQLQPEVHRIVSCAASLKGLALTTDALGVYLSIAAR